MSEYVWIQHPQTEGRAYVRKDAVPQYRQSGWDLLGDDEAQAHEQAQRDEQTTAEQRLVEQGKRALRNAGLDPTERPEFAPAPVERPEQVAESAEPKALPSKNAPKPEWEQAARDAEIPEDEISNMTKDQLVERLTGNKE